MCRYITGFQTEQDVRLTLEAMEKKGWVWVSGTKPTGWDGWRVNSGNYGNFSISYEYLFGWSVLPKEDTIYFRDAIRELTGEASSTYATYADVLKNNGREFSCTIDGEYVSGVIDVGLENSTTFYFNSSNTGWRSNAKIGYSRGWSIGPANLPKDITIKNPTMNTNTTVVDEINATDLPEYFTIPCNSDNKKNPLWKKYIDWLNGKYDGENMGNSNSGFYGHHKNGDTYNLSYGMKGEPQITLEEWDSMVGSTTVDPVEVDTTVEVEIPEFYYIKRAPTHPLWKKYITWLNKEHSARWTGDDYVYYGYDGRCDCHMDAAEFNGKAKEITLEFWNMYMGIPGVPAYATEDMVSYGTASAARMKTATGASSGHWPSTRIDGNDPLRMAHDAAMYGTAVSYATPTSTNNSIYESFRQAGKAHNAMMNSYIDGQSIQGSTPSQVFIDETIDEAPTKTSRYSSMLDLI